MTPPGTPCIHAAYPRLTQTPRKTPRWQPTVGGKTTHIKIWMTCLPRPSVALWEALVSQLWNQYNLSNRLNCSKMGWATTSSRKIPWPGWPSLGGPLALSAGLEPSFQCASGFLSAHECGFKHFKKISSWYHCPMSEMANMFHPMYQVLWACCPVGWASSVTQLSLGFTEQSNCENEGLFLDLPFSSICQTWVTFTFLPTFWDSWILCIDSYLIMLEIFFFLSVFLHSIIHYTLMEFVGRNTDIYLLKHGMTLSSIKLLTKIDLRNVGTSLFLITRNPEVVALEIIHSTAQ